MRNHHRQLKTAAGLGGMNADPEALREMQPEQAEMHPGNRPGAGRLSA